VEGEEKVGVRGPQSAVCVCVWDEGGWGFRDEWMKEEGKGVFFFFLFWGGKREKIRNGDKERCLWSVLACGVGGDRDGDGWSEGRRKEARQRVRKVNKTRL